MEVWNVSINSSMYLYSGYRKMGSPNNSRDMTSYKSLLVLGVF